VTRHAGRKRRDCTSVGRERYGGDRTPVRHVRGTSRLISASMLPSLMDGFLLKPSVDRLPSQPRRADAATRRRTSPRKWPRSWPSKLAIRSSAFRISANFCLPCRSEIAHAEHALPRTTGFAAHPSGEAATVTQAVLLEPRTPLTSRAADRAAQHNLTRVRLHRSTRPIFRARRELQRTPNAGTVGKGTGNPRTVLRGGPLHPARAARVPAPRPPLPPRSRNDCASIAISPESIRMTRPTGITEKIRSRTTSPAST